MVNETNKPQEILENEQLGQRLAASNQALADIQAEHRQLLEEMEELRRRAEMLQRLREQQEREEDESKLQCQQNINQVSETSDSKDQTKDVIENSEEPKEEDNNEADPEEADYIKEKLAEIARLKAQFKRVQHMINTTELIENHISKNEATETKSAKEAHKAKSDNEVETEITTTAPIASITATDPELMTIPNMPSLAELNAATTSDEKEQLILTMLNMFQDFSSDLRSQADNLRAERERIKELKESIIRSRKDQPK